MSRAFKEFAKLQASFLYKVNYEEVYRYLNGGYACQGMIIL